MRPRKTEITRRHWTPSELQVLTNLATQDKPKLKLETIAKRLHKQGYAERTPAAVSQKLNELGIQRPPQQSQRPWSEEETDLLTSLVRSRNRPTIPAIAQQLKRKPRAVYDRLHRLGIYVRKDAF